MKKRRFILFALVVLFAFSLTTFLAACDDFNYGVDTLTFDVNGTTYKVVPVKDLNGKIPVEDPIPNDDKYEFVGWFWDSELKERVKDSELYKGELPHFIAYAGFEDPYGHWTTSMDAKNLDKSGGSGGTGGSGTGGSGETGGTGEGGDTGGSNEANVNDYTFELGADGNSYVVTGINPIMHSGTAINIPSKYEGKPVTTIGANAFDFKQLEDGYYIKTLTIPSSIVVINAYAFDYCSGLTNVVIPNSVEYIGMYAFSNCVSLTSVTLPNNSNFTKIPERLFLNCENLTTITIPDNVKEIGASAFEECQSLTSINISSGMTEVQSGSFYNTHFEKIYIPRSITNIATHAFNSAGPWTVNCFITDIYYEGSSTEWDNISKGTIHAINDETTIHYNQTW